VQGWSSPGRARRSSANRQGPQAGGDPVLLGHRRRGLRRQPEAPHVAGGTRHPVRAGRKCSEMIPTAAGKKRADKLAALVPGDGWQRLSCADGSKGARFYDWALVTAKSPQHHLLVRRSLQPKEKGVLELAFFSAAGRSARSPSPNWRRSRARAPGEWRTASARRRTRQATDHYQVRKYRRLLSSPAPPAEAAGTRRLKRGPNPCGQPFAPARTYAPPAFITDAVGRDLIPLAAADELRCLGRAGGQSWRHWALVR